MLLTTQTANFILCVGGDCPSQWIQFIWRSSHAFSLHNAIVPGNTGEWSSGPNANHQGREEFSSMCIF